MTLASRPEPGTLFEISAAHARGLRRNLFAHYGASLARRIRTLAVRLRCVRWPYRSVRESQAAYRRAREAMHACGGYWNERRSGTAIHSCSIMLHPQQVQHADQREPVLAVTLFLMIAEQGRVSVAMDHCGRISHHAIERMYQRLRTNSHETVMAELHSALGRTMLLRNAALTCSRAAIIHQLPVPTERGALRCVTDPRQMSIEARTYTLRRPGDRIDASVQSIRRWCGLPPDDRESGFIHLLRDPANRWWREPYPHRAQAILGNGDDD